MDNSYVFSTSTILDNLCKSLAKSSQEDLCKIVVQNNGLYFLKKLEENNVTVDNLKLLHQASVTGRLDIIIHLKEKGVNIHNLTDDAFRFSAFEGHLDIAEYLLKDGADINAMEGNALKACVSHRKIDIVKFLLDNGADINYLEETAYKILIEKDRIEMLKLLSQKSTSIKINFI